MTKAEFIGAAGYGFVRLLVSTLRIRIDDRVGALGSDPQRPLLWVFWHNRLLTVPYLFERYCPGRTGAALTSASADGELLSAFLRRFGVDPIRGSSSRGGAVAMVQMRRALQRGSIMAITPDGPRGPRFHVHPGIVKLAQVTRMPVMPLHITYSRAWRLRSWDGFLIPKPFARVDFTFDALHEVAPTDDEAAFERERLRLEQVLREPVRD